MRTIEYRPDIDGLRAVAVTLVLLNHANIAFPGGYVGVDVFFVISGFLITSILSKQHQSNSFSLSSFWTKRVLRIAPASLLMQAATLVAGVYFLLPTDLKDLALSILANCFLVSNFYFSSIDGYFDEPSSYRPLLHTWSLAVEEQFYVLFPLFLSAVQRFRRATQFCVVTAIAILSLLASEAFTYTSPTMAYFLLPFRSWELLLGVSLYYIPKQRFFRESFNFFGILLILYAALTFRDTTPFPGFSALIPCLGTALIIIGNNNHPSRIGRILGSTPLTYFGRLSYSLYLWHWPVLVFIRHWRGSDITPFHGMCGILFSILLSIFSYHLIELPFRSAATVKLRRMRYAIGLYVITSFLVIITSFLALTDGARNFRSAELLGAIDNYEWDGRSFLREMRKDPESGLPILGSSQPPSIVVWGDSHAAVCSEVIDSVAKRHRLSAVIGWEPAVCPVPLNVALPSQHAERPPSHSEQLLSVSLRPQITDVIFIARWSLYVEGFSDFELQMNPRLDRRKHLLTDASHEKSPDRAASLLLERMCKLIETLESSGKRVWIIRQPPEANQAVAKDLLYSTRFGTVIRMKTSTSQQTKARETRVNIVFDQLNSKGAVILDAPSSPYDDREQLVTIINSQALYRDGNHLSRFGASYIMTPVFDDIFHSISSLNGASKRELIGE